MSLKVELKKKEIIHSVGTGFLPKKVLVPLTQENEIECKSLVTKGQFVQEGELIAEYEKGLFSDAAKIHSPIPGIVCGIKKCTFPNGKPGDAIEIEMQGSFSHIGKKNLPREISYMSTSMLVTDIAEKGVVNTFEQRKPCSLATSVNKLKKKDNIYLFVRLYDEDPLVQTDSVLCLCAQEKIASGIKILLKILPSAHLVFAINKKNQIELDKSPFSDLDFEVLEMNTRVYPCGGKLELCEQYAKQNNLKDTTSLKNALFVDATTLVTLCNAIVYETPVEWIYVHVSGDCLKSSAVLKVCVGTSIRFLSEQCGLKEKNIGKIIVNSSFNGFSVPSLDTPLSKYVKSVTFCSKNDIFDYSTSICIKCGECSKVCPVGISPNVIYEYIINGVHILDNYKKSVVLCTECALCGTVCPANLPLSTTIKLLKEKNKDVTNEQ